MGDGLEKLSDWQTGNIIIIEINKAGSPKEKKFLFGTFFEYKAEYMIFTAFLHKKDFSIYIEKIE